MRVPSVGLTLSERREIRAIVIEAYALADRLLAGYRDPPSFREQVGAWFSRLAHR